MKFGIVGNLQKKELPNVVRELLNRVQEESVQFLLSASVAKAVSRVVGKAALRRARIVNERSLLAESDLIIALGGDGTILETARLVGSHETPILGINLGKLGFLAEVSIEESEQCLREILERRYNVEERIMLQATTPALKKPFYALNDVVIDKYGTSRVMSIETHVNNEYLATYSADGIIISTPTGSTAYSLANGGPIVVPSNHALIISPICPHTLTARPVIVPDESVVTITIFAASRQVHLTADGQLEDLFKPPVTITVKKAPFKARLVKRQTTNYYDVLRKKLNWGSDVRVRGGEK
ncbi:MAG: NAD(+)/NADH kinase [Bacteroidota bacterium]